MASPSPTKPKCKAEQEAQQKAARRASQANILAGARPLLEQDEQLLAFARARVAGGWRSKLNVGPEAFFAPFVNVGPDRAPLPRAACASYQRQAQRDAAPCLRL